MWINRYICMYNTENCCLSPTKPVREILMKNMILSSYFQGISPFVMKYKKKTISLQWKNLEDIILTKKSELTLLSTIVCLFMFHSCKKNVCPDSSWGHIRQTHIEGHFTMSCTLPKCQCHEQKLKVEDCYRFENTQGN